MNYSSVEVVQRYPWTFSSPQSMPNQKNTNSGNFVFEKLARNWLCVHSKAFYKTWLYLCRNRRTNLCGGFLKVWPDFSDSKYGCMTGMGLVIALSFLVVLLYFALSCWPVRYLTSRHLTSRRVWQRIFWWLKTPYLTSPVVVLSHRIDLQMMDGLVWTQGRHDQYVSLQFEYHHRSSMRSSLRLWYNEICWQEKTLKNTWN